jgi:probable HAF family extracellular repeat protein
VLGGVTKLLLLGALGFAADAGADEKPLLIELPPQSLAADLGAGGFVVVGAVLPAGGFYWMPTGGVVLIGGNQANAVSKDGRTIVGRANDARGLENAAIWQGATDWRVLGSFRPDAQPCDALLSASFGASADGRVVVGLGWDGCRIAHAFRWEESTGMADLGSIVPERASRANNVSGDGHVVIGWQDDFTGFRQGARWIDGREELFAGPNGPVGEAHAANTTGTLVVGSRCDSLATEQSAWTWTASEGVRCYPVPRQKLLNAYVGQMLATSEDGRVIGGAQSFGNDSEAVLWIDGQAHYLKEYLEDRGLTDPFKDWVNTGFVTGVSPDGRTLVGQGAGPRGFQGYVVILPSLGPRPVQ